MSLIINGVEIPNTGDNIFYGSTNIDTVVCDGVEVWKKQKDIDILSTYDRLWNDRRSGAGGHNTTSNEYFPSAAGSFNAATKQLEAAHRAAPRVTDNSDRKQWPWHTVYASSEPGHRNQFHYYFVKYVDLTNYTKIEASGKVWTGDSSNNNGDKVPGRDPVDEIGRFEDDGYDAYASIAIELMTPVYTGSTITSMRPVALSSSTQYPGHGVDTWKYFDRSTSMDISALTGSYIVCIGMNAGFGEHCGTAQNAYCRLTTAKIS